VVEVDVPPTHRSGWQHAVHEAGLVEREFRAACRRHRYRAGEVIFHEGDPAGSLHLIERGHVAVRLTTERGEEAIIDVLRPGESFGEQALIDTSGVRTASVSAIDRAETLALDAITFVRLGEENPQIVRFVMMVLAERLRSTNRELLDALCVVPERRLARRLVRLADQFGDGEGPVTVPVIQADIAAMIGVTRPTANRLLQRAQADGLVDLGRGRVVVVDRDGLRRRSGRD